MNDLSVTGTLIWYYYICKREVWLMARQIEPEQDNPLIELGRVIGETTYKRDKKQIRLENITIDLTNLDGDQVVIGEVKKSSRFRESARMQLCYYLHVLRNYGVEARGELLFPKEKRREEVLLTDEAERRLRATIKEIKEIAERELPPSAVKIKYCSSCAYNEFCWS